MTQTIPCVICKSEITSGAILCPVCKSYQTTWKRRLQYMATIGGLATVFIAVVTYIATSWSDVRKVFFWRDRVTVTSLDSLSGVITFSNTGDGDVFISHFLLHSDAPKFSQSWAVNTLAKVNTFTSTPPRQQQEEGWGTGSLSDQKWQEILTHSEDECFKWVFYDVNNPHCLNLQQFCGEGFRKLSLVGSIFFNSSHDESRQTRDVPIDAVPFFRKTEACAAKLGIRFR
jgi:hypothetical protein